jgi:hypothetical protein
METLLSTRGQSVVVLKNTGGKHGTRLGGRGRRGSTQLPGSPARKVTTNLRRLLHTVYIKPYPAFPCPLCASASVGRTAVRFFREGV